MTTRSRSRVWQQAHLGTDRKLLRATLPAGLVEDAEAFARSRGLSLAALTAIALTLVQRHDENLGTALRILERTHHMRFRPPADLPPSLADRAPAPAIAQADLAL